VLLVPWEAAGSGHVKLDERMVVALVVSTRGGSWLDRLCMWKTILTAFATVFVAELGDKTQLATLGLTTEARSKRAVFIGSAYALVTTSLIAVLAGSLAAMYVPQRAAGALFLILAIWTLWKSSSIIGEDEYRRRPELTRTLNVSPPVIDGNVGGAAQRIRAVSGYRRSARRFSTSRAAPNSSTKGIAPNIAGAATTRAVGRDYESAGRATMEGQERPRSVSAFVFNPR
jgi:Ca2+/H+ antiporter, TMEM165/GDT1 family